MKILFTGNFSIPININLQIYQWNSDPDLEAYLSKNMFGELTEFYLDLDKKINDTHQLIEELKKESNDIGYLITPKSATDFNFIFHYGLLIFNFLLFTVLIIIICYLVKYFESVIVSEF